jgi:hypothetical protein
MAREPQSAEGMVGNLPSPAPRVTKAQIVLDLLQRCEGCSLDDLVAATRWQPHTARAVLTGLRKKGHQLTSWKPETGSRIYRIVEAGQ